MKKGFKIGAMSLACLMVFGVAGCGKVSDKDGKAWAEKNGYIKEETLAALPSPVKDTAECDVALKSKRYSAGCSTINADNLKDYMGRSDTVYLDVRNSVSDGAATALPTNEYSGLHLKDFSNVEFFAYVYSEEKSKQLFYKEGTRFAPTYATSVQTLEALFPKDKTLFIMCQSGARVVVLMQILDQFGWDMSKVYNVGGMSQYTEAKGYGDYRLEATSAYAYTEKTGTATATVSATNLNATVKVLLDTETNKIGGVYLTDGTTSSESYADSWNAELNDLLDSFIGLTVTQVRAKVVNGALASDVDVVASATVSTKLIYDAVINALSDVVIE